MKTWFVNSRAPVTGEGSKERPFRSIAEAFDLAADHDHIVLAKEHHELLPPDGLRVTQSELMLEVPDGIDMDISFKGDAVTVKSRD